MKLPKFLIRKLPIGPLCQTQNILKNLKINTVCFEANCPNKFECYSKKYATFLALGKKCTRSCAFCNIEYCKNPPPPDDEEPKNIAIAAKKLKLKHIVITMVTRDDLEDKGANHISKIIKEVKLLNPNSSIEILTSDFGCRFDLIDIILNQNIDIFNYNIETVKRLTPKIRHIATYENSLKILKYAKDSKKIKLIKSGFMVGLGEIKQEIFSTIKDLKTINCDIITIGQYLSPGKKNYPVKSFISPLEFKEFEKYGKKLGIKKIYAQPYVRSSYNADLFLKNFNRK